MRSDLLYVSCISSALQDPIGKMSSNRVSLEKDSLSSGPLVLFCAVVPTCKLA